MSSSKQKIVVVSSSDHPTGHTLSKLLGEVASCEHLVIGDDSAGVESQQIDQHNAKQQSVDMQEKLEELLSDRKFTGAQHVYLLQGENLTNPSSTHAGMLKALMEKALITDKEVVAVLVPEQSDNLTGDMVQQNFDEAVASHESLLKPFGKIKVFSSPITAAHHLGAF